MALFIIQKFNMQDCTLKLPYRRGNVDHRHKKNMPKRETSKTFLYIPVSDTWEVD